jgi:hypothetical protein
MKRTILLAMLMLALAAPAAYSADWDHKTVGDAVDRMKAGKHRVDLRNDYPEEKVHLISFDVVPGKLNYLIDAKAHNCYFRWTAGASAVSMVEVSCKSIKDGYPLMAPIIDWEP